MEDVTHLKLSSDSFPSAAFPLLPDTGLKVELVTAITPPPVNPPPVLPPAPPLESVAAGGWGKLGMIPEPEPPAEAE